MICGTVLFNLMAAYDVIDHKLEKFECYECRQSAAGWMESYLLNRLKNFSSLMEVIHIVCPCGVPQGNYLGPHYFRSNLLLILRMIN